MQDFSLGEYFGEQLYPPGLLAQVFRLGVEGVAVEFGVGDGQSLRFIAQRMPVIGFDSFQGLPEDWREGFPKGMFSCPPPVVENAEIIVGLFDDTLPKFVWPKDIGLVHIDCDLYSSTQTVLRYTTPHIHSGCYIIFDEYHGYPGCENHEQRAWREYVQDKDIQWEVIGHGSEQWGIRLS